MSEKKSLFNESLDKETSENSKLFKEISEFSQVKNLHFHFMTKSKHRIQKTSKN